MLTYLQLSEEFGGTRFGPIKLPEYRLGSAEGNEVQLAEGLGVEPFHVRMIKKGGDTFYLAPVERTAAVWLYRAGQQRPELLHGPTVIRAGDGFALVTPEGVRFTVAQQEEHRPSMRSGAAGGKDDNGMGDSARRYGNRVVQEVWRRIRAAALATYVGRMMQNTWFFVKTGQIFSPLYVIGFLMMFSGWGVGLRSCSKAKTSDTKLAAVQLDHEDCQIELDGYRGGGTKDSRLSLGQLTARIHGDRSWESSLEWGEATNVMKKEIANLLGPGADLDRTWFTGSGAPYSVLVKRLSSQGMPEPAARVLAWSGVNPYVDLAKRRKLVEGRTEMWDLRRADTEAYQQCLRGPFRLSYVQASRLGLTTAEDAFFDRRAVGKIEGVVSNEDRKATGVDNISDAFNAQRGAMSLAPDLEDINKTTVGSVTVPEGSCFYRKRDDSRLSLGNSAKAMVNRLGAVSGLPGEGNTNWITARVALLYLYELDGNGWSSLNMNNRHLDAEFASLAQRDVEGADHVATSVGNILALATAVPCLLLLERGPDSYPEVMGEPPDFDACAILSMRAQHNQL